MNVGKQSSFRLWRWYSVLLLAYVMTWPRSVKGETREMDLKAVLLYHCIHFVGWPKEAFQDQTSPIVIGILGRDPFGESLDTIVKDETFDGRIIQIQRFEKMDQVQMCHILFISDSEEPDIAQILAQLKGRSILTVTDVPDLPFRGVMIGFKTAKQKIQIEINLEASKVAGLTISSRLLRQAEIIKGMQEQP